ncbi:MAG: type II toxin-antitoxin system HipA family toxin [Lachnospiraceae bacterium]|nr:type II toxin-antitoxin system HipA family toxin [Lachnospiraceae bacterium]
MADVIREIYVYMSQKDLTVQPMGTLYAAAGKGKITYSFAYEKEWLQMSEIHYVLDPELSFFSGRQYAAGEKRMFGIFSDSCPDRWGRLLMDRREVLRARKEERKPRKLMEVDYLLGVYDESRMGAMRFAVNPNGPFLASDQELAAPPWTTLRQLETASLAFEQDEGGLSEKWLEQLLAPGSSLGGARPKASVQDSEGNLWIAKFPSRHDTYDSGRWEMVVHDLAEKCGLCVPEAKLEQFSEVGSTFLVKRFDREGKRRIHFASSMTLLGKKDGDAAAEGVGYLDLAAFIKANGACPKEDLREMWRRIVFSIAVSNTDDHLRNHGFLLDDAGWRLSPLYDVNPCVYGDTLSLNISEEDNSMDYELVISTAPYYGISHGEAERMVRDISGEVQQNWRLTAKRYGAGRSAIEYLSPAFSLQYK